MPETFLIVGLGSIGLRHARLLRELRPHARIVALRSGAIDQTGKEFVTEQVTRLPDAMVPKPAAAIIANPAPFHATCACELLAAGIPVLIEKPLAASYSDAVRLAEAVSASSAFATVGYTLRSHPSFLEALKFAHSEIGRISYVRAEAGQFLPDWRPGSDYRQSVSAQKALGGGALLELSHEIDLVQSIIGEPSAVTAVVNKLSRLEIDVEDVSELILQFGSERKIGSVHVDFLARRPFRTLRILGENGTVYWDVIEDRLELESEASGRTVRVSENCADRDIMYRNQLVTFLERVDGRGGDSLPTVREGLEVMRTIEMARSSARSGQTQTRGEPFT